MYGRFVDNVFEAAPIDFITEDGRIICNFDKNIEEMEKAGFSEVEVKPYPTVEEGFTAVEVYRRISGQIIQDWEIVEIEGYVPIPEPDEPMPEEIPDILPDINA